MDWGLFAMYRERFSILVRYPEPGKAKTRLIPVLGPQGAADLHRRMAERTLSWAREFRRLRPVSLEVRYEGGNGELMRQWVGEDILLTQQGDGNLGRRMARAFAEAFQGGLERVVLVGTDIPGMTEGHAQKAFAALAKKDVVLGPAKDGGYYLIGLRKPCDQLFKGIPWGTREVLPKTLRVAWDFRLKVFLLEALADVDRPGDLSVWEKAEQNSMGEALPRISIIIPALNEEERIAACLASTQKSSNVERIVVDGGSRDKTVELARSLGARVLPSSRGRAPQMNTGAERATGELLLFLHADTCLPEGFDRYVREILAQPDVAAGAFGFRLDGSSRSLRLIERVANWRARKLQMPYGDQAIFLRADLFRAVGGYPEMPIMEDFELIRRLKRKGRVEIAPVPAITSPRRWLKQGTWKTTFLHWATVVAYYAGVSPFRIHRFARRKG
ncbi:MAG: TIGR04283 family arsenosugar biosynthesis glycosyltransferase [Deltaproteobacteria bacterium]|nr:TIGR04283 family arsenosugar biosynthesis glycosyltransferase [Deltaproteobacteria bacterium]